MNFLDLYRHGAIYVDKILKGARPAELPGLTIPPALLLRADQIIE